MQVKPPDTGPVPHIQCLPLELLDYIFYIYCGISFPIGFQTLGLTWELSQVPESTFPALILTHVCSRWRDIALSNPSLWSRIELREPLDDTADKIISSLQHLVELYLTRSRQSPLDLVIEFTNYIFQYTEVVELPKEKYDVCLRLLSIYNLFFTEAHRWRNAYLCLPLRFFEPNWSLDNWPKHFPVLEELAVHIFGDEAIFRTRSSMEILSAPKLHTLTHTGHGIEIMSCTRKALSKNGPNDASAGSSIRSPSFDSLRSFTFSQILYKENLCLACPLTKMTLRKIGGFANPRSGTVCLAKNLVILAQAENVIWSLPRTFHCMTCPNLVALLLEIPITRCPTRFLVQRDHNSDLPLFAKPISRRDQYDTRDEEFANFLSRSSAANITHFSIINFRVKDEYLVSVLLQLPSLSHLALADVIFRDYGDSGDHRVGTNNDAKSEEAEREWRQQGFKLMFSRWFFRSLSFSNSNGSATHNSLKLIPSLRELHVGFSRGQGRGAIFALLDMVQSRSLRSGLQFVRVKLVSDRNRDCSDSESYHASEEHLHLEEEIGEIVQRRLDQLGEFGTPVELEWTDTVSDWRAGLGSWKLED
ncbi:hypothetical protein VKT23_012613 [Stygiomarasmius scandens]|uniref:F-box domain-containing protein n=1 Tax=Marasmiellus scandens TaxID=2682957 RepID=A0ABR1J6C0_9AGAR